MRFHDVTVTDVRPEGTGAVAVTLNAPGFAWEPGQYLTLRATVAGQDLRRSYSIAQAPGGPLTVGIKSVAGGAFSPFAQGLRPGDVLRALPPEGRFVYRGEQRILLIAAGSGITPMVSIAQAALASGAEVTLVYGNRDGASIMFREALDDLKDRHLDRFVLFHCLSRETQDVAFLNGRITGDKIRVLAEVGAIVPNSFDAAFLCGPGDMIGDVSTALSTLGLPADHIHHEMFFTDTTARPPRSEAARSAAESGVQVEVLLDGTARRFDMQAADDNVVAAAERAGLELPWSCRGGMCCTCRCKVVAGSAEMAVNYSLEDWELAQGFTLACQARPTSDHLVLDFDAS